MRSRVFVVAGLVVACAAPTEGSRLSHDEPPSTGTGARLSELRAVEASLRASYAPGRAAPFVDVSGSDPYRIVPAGDGGFFGLLRGSRALVRLDPELRERARVTLPATPTALCRAGAGVVWIASRYDPRLWRVELGAAPTLSEHAGSPGGVADLECGSDGSVYVLPSDGSELVTLDAGGRERGRFPALAGGLRLRRVGGFLLESSLFERSLRVLSLDARGVPARELARIRHDGTLWAFDALERDGELLIALSGVEDRALVRAHGEFENIDSFVWLYRLKGGALEELHAVDVSDLDVVLPKTLGLARRGSEIELRALGAGSGRLLRARFSGSLADAPVLETEPAPPGAADAVFEGSGRVVYASPLLDAWVELEPARERVVRVEPERRPEPDQLLGEALFFTELIAPENRSTGTHSRFTCETCHFEGGVDGRVHYTGRADVSVVTKPLFGLANNRPHFSRALDPDLSSVCHNEFRVAGAGSGTDPWFRLSVARYPWLSELGVARAELGPLELRRALLTFLYSFSHAPNPRSQGRQRFSALEAEGARAFREHCERCHAARLASDDPRTRAPFEAWEGRIFSRNAPLVWARGDYEKSGILPYVHERGTRVTSLRRLALKPRYFTNGSAPDLENVLERFRDGPAAALHDAGESRELAPLSSATRGALLAFLRLL